MPDNLSVPSELLPHSLTGAQGASPAPVPEPPAAPGKRPWWVWLISAALILALGGGGYAYYWYNNLTLKQGRQIMLDALTNKDTVPKRHTQYVNTVRGVFTDYSTKLKSTSQEMEKLSKMDSALPSNPTVADVKSLRKMMDNIFQQANSVLTITQELPNEIRKKLVSKGLAENKAKLITHDLEKLITDSSVKQKFETASKSLESLDKNLNSMLDILEKLLTAIEQKDEAALIRLQPEMEAMQLKAQAVENTTIEKDFDAIGKLNAADIKGIDPEFAKAFDSSALLKNE